MVTRGVLLLPIISLLSACAAVPTGPSVMVLPGVGKPFDQFQMDDVACRQFAQAQTGLPPGEAGARASRVLQSRYDVSYMQCMYAKGHQLPGTRPAPQSSSVPPPLGTPPPPGAGTAPPAPVAPAR
ncbi:MAG: glycine zipper family protein [Candidatus Tectomicrobia bacterium]|nr:glycine zipper family protein [Candidatus Tectomicrobia bacterium]